MAEMASYALRASGKIVGVSARVLGKSAYYVSKGAYNAAKGVYEGIREGDSENDEEETAATNTDSVALSSFAGSSGDPLDIMLVPQLRNEIRKYNCQSLGITSARINKGTRDFLIGNI